MSCELDKIVDEKIKHVNLKNYFKLISDLMDLIIDFLSGNMWEQLEVLNDKIE